MGFNGLGQRLSMDAAGVIATYVLDGDRPLSAESGGNTNFYLYGLGAIGEKTDAWSFALPDGTNIPRQLTDANGEITLASRYTPWGDTLEIRGAGNFTYGYLEGILDVATNLIYVGNGQYYDPTTGRFLTRDVNPNSTNPYTPWNPIGAIVGPLGVISAFYSRKKKGGKGGTWIVLLLVTVTVGMTLSACGGGNGTPPSPSVPPAVPCPTPATSTPAPTSTPSAPSQTPTPPVTLEWFSEDFKLTYYHYPLENDPVFVNDPLGYLVNVKFSYGYPNPEYHQHRYSFVYDLQKGVVKQGTGITANNQYITIDHFTTLKHYNISNINDVRVDDYFFLYEEGGAYAHSIPWKTVGNRDPKTSSWNKNNH
ncbi:MAG: hypothetical protein IPM31_16675 [Anaerolineae bacterium]|nr:hypothetical protein [Anaerolineae bacterium]